MIRIIIGFFMVVALSNAVAKSGVQGSPRHGTVHASPAGSGVQG